MRVGSCGGVDRRRAPAGASAGCQLLRPPAALTSASVIEVTCLARDTFWEQMLGGGEASSSWQQELS